VQFLANLGLAVLFFFAGLEVVEKRVQREAIVRGSAGWALSLILGLAAGYALHAAGLGAAASTEATIDV
jgi:Kef-type K+ transport system membrane component KefB